jgi:chemotaxis-related protein WspB
VQPKVAAAQPLLLVLTVAGQRHAIRATHVVEVLPALTLQPVALPPPGVAGLFDYRGTLVPVVDLGVVLAGRPCQHRLGSRVAVVNLGQPPHHRLVGLLAEGCALRHGDATPTQQGLHRRQADFLGPVLPDEDGLLQILDPELLIGEAMCEAVLGPDAPVVGAPRDA